MGKRKKTGNRRVSVPEQKIRMAMGVYPGRTRREVKELLETEVTRYLLLALLVSLVLLLGSAVFFVTKAGEETRIKRPDAGSSSVVQKVQIETENGWKEINIPIEAREYTSEEIDAFYAESKEYLDRMLLGENTTFEEIQQNLYFPETVPGKFSVDWSTDALWLVDAKGQVHNETLSETRRVTVTANIYYGKEFRRYERIITIVPKAYTSEEVSLMAAEETLKEWEAATRTEEEPEVPKELAGRKLRVPRETGWSLGSFLLLLSVLFPVLVYHFYFEKLEDCRKQRREEAKKRYTEVVTKLSLMIVAGIPVRQAWERLWKDYKRTRGEQYVLTQELYVTCQELNYGTSETAAYEAFGDRIGVVAYQRMAAVLAQNTTKGMQNIRQVLLQEAKEVMAEERMEIKIRGEQTGTKLLLPMMGYLILIFTVLLVPAFGMF